MTFFNLETEPDPDRKPTFEQKTDPDPDRLPKEGLYQLQCEPEIVPNINPILKSLILGRFGSSWTHMIGNCGKF
jgi:hypothetical protein